MITREPRFIRDLGSGRGLMEVVSSHLPEETDEKHRNPQSGYSVFRLRFEPRTWSVIANAQCSVGIFCLLSSTREKKTGKKQIRHP
jgi:hypothetical protein